MTAPRQLVVAALVAPLLLSSSLSLGGCGSGSGSAPAEVEDPPSPGASEPGAEPREEEPLGLEIRVPAPAGPAADYDCRMPALPIPRPRACERGRPYPACKWHVPHALESRGTWRRWRNTIPEHMYGRPSLVSVVVTTAALFHERHPEQVFAIGDLDAAGGRGTRPTTTASTSTSTCRAP